MNKEDFLQDVISKGLESYFEVSSKTDSRPYKEMVELHRKLASVYSYLDKVLEFKDHYQFKCEALEKEVEELKEKLEEQNQEEEF
jgi:hypothetical protein